ncbi:MAG TPA: hypothetical protein VN702_09910 [Acetobacteraceae bacterium]|nr:hypothetical protein [Acetobacteraceae bacterium]
MPNRTTSAASPADRSAGGPGAPTAAPTLPPGPMPAVLARTVRATAAAVPALGDDRATRLAAVIDAFESFNPRSLTDFLLVSRFLILGGAFESLQQRALDPDLPAAQAERLTRTALAAFRLQERILRLLSRDDATTSAEAQAHLWHYWRQDLMRREELERAAEAARAAAEAADEAEGAAEAETAEAAMLPRGQSRGRTPTRPAAEEPESMDVIAAREGWGEAYKNERSEFDMFLDQSMEGCDPNTGAKPVNGQAAPGPHAP